ncbi:cytochrome P450 [Rhizoclosmatium globosum]|uniref:Cytochrome P450 n=1 Tax=Rhizoclosmatium globosum TaxID=329046 RepID=A0A1Y2D1W3_9FUNG|nr:cytochrome P450 [Rhizoclosmatium globosum]|eukprot:ORY53124.1 cytochrome P450 [Rhizoclosmatium globosum]
MFDWFAPQRKKDGPPIASNCHPLIGHYLAFTNPHGNIGLSSIIFKGLEHENVVEARLFGKTVYVARGPENQRTGGSDDVAADKLGMLHTGILFNSDIPSWRLHRKLLVHNIARPKFLAALIPRLNQYMNSIIPAIDELASSGESVNINDLGASIILDITMDVIFSEQPNAASNFIHECVTCTTNPATNKLIHIVRAFHNAQQILRYDSSEPEDFASTLLQGISDEITFDSIVSVIKEMILDLVLPELDISSKGSNVIALLSENHRNEAVWENASTFDPLRFMSDRNEGGLQGLAGILHPLAMEFENALALLETKLILAHLCKHYQWRQESGNISDLSVVFEARS